MNLLIRYCKGYVRVRLIGNMPERFLNLCAANQIFLWNLLSDEGSYLLSMSIQDFRRLKPLCRKSGCTLHIVEKHGMPFFFYQNRKRKGFFIGIFLFAGLLYLLSCFIWNIHVDGNHANSTYAILAFLEQNGVHHGIWKNRIVLLTFLIETCACCKENFSAGEEIFHSTFFTRQRFLKNEIP